MGAVLAVQDTGQHLDNLRNFDGPRFPPLWECRQQGPDKTRSAATLRCADADDETCWLRPPHDDIGRPLGCAIEIGTNKGMIVSHFASLYPGAWFFTFEPFPSVQSKLKSTGLPPNVHLMPYGVSDAATNGTAIGPSGLTEPLQLRSVREMLTSIVTICGRAGKGLDFLWINCEGCEYRVLPALLLPGDWNRWRLRLLQIEWHAHMPWLGTEKQRKSTRCAVERTIREYGGLLISETEKPADERWLLPDALPHVR